MKGRFNTLIKFLALSAQEGEGFCSLPNRVLAQKTGLSLRTVAQQLRELEAGGHIVRTKGHPENSPVPDPLHGVGGMTRRIYLAGHSHLPSGGAGACPTEAGRGGAAAAEIPGCEPRRAITANQARQGPIPCGSGCLYGNSNDRRGRALYGPTRLL
jgi:hypothetical protein